MISEEERDGARYRWLLATWDRLDTDTRWKVVRDYRRVLDGGGIRLGKALFEALVRHGITPVGTDPYPPKAFVSTEEGAEEYEEILAAQELMHGD